MKNLYGVIPGIKYGWRTAAGNELAVRLEYYRQDGDIAPDQLFGEGEYAA